MERTEKVRAYDTAKQRGVPVYLRHEHREGCSGSLPIYVRLCEDCQAWSETYPQGHGAKIRCKRCRHAMVMKPATEFGKQTIIFGLRHAPKFTYWLLRAYVFFFEKKPSESKEK